MTLYQYNVLDKTDQPCVLWNKGVYLAERKDGEHTIALYQLDGFYVEVFYHGQENAIKQLRSFSSVEQLSCYLDKINVTALLH